MKYDYEAEKRKLYVERLDEASKATKRDWMKLKIKNFAEKFGFSEKKVSKEIKNNKIVAANFIKDPGKQNFYQKQALEFLNSMSIVKSAKQLAAGGKNALYIVNGKIGHKKDFSSGVLDDIKSIDFKIELVDGRVILASHKYTKDHGGAQDNQKNDLLTFVRNAEKYKGDEYILMAIADGEYYKNPDVNKQFEKAANKKVLVLNMENFESIMGVDDA